MDRKNELRDKFYTGNLQRDYINFNLYKKVTGFDKEIKYNDEVGFKQFQDIMFRGDK